MDEEETQTTKPQAVFEFTKRKRWADLLISELVNVGILVFSQTGTIIHCDAAIHSVTGYSEDQIIGKNFSDLLHEGDTLAFFKEFEDCISSQRELTFYLRIKAPDSRDKSIRLIELKASPYVNEAKNECLCVFAMLSPYPPSSVGDLDDYLALKIENEQLAHKIEELQQGIISDESFEEDEDDLETMRGHHPQTDSIVHRSEKAIAQASAALDAAAAAAAAVHSTGQPSAASLDPNSDISPAKKKRRMLDDTLGRVCTSCGRNNSPEWRKGPQGPKTLCNACGLRWAKKTKGISTEGD
ncbi:blue light receptor [Serendipita sp. 396]|nr:blue light receptor [Serendipita sp. 396]